MAEKGFDAKTAQTYAALLATLLSEKDFLLDSQSLQDSAHEECDLYLRARLLAGDRDHHARLDRAAMSTMKRILRSQYDVTDNALRDTSANWNEKLVFRLLLEAFPDRVARRRRPKAPQARMVGSKGIELHASSSVRDAEFFFALRGDAGVSRTSGDPLTTLASSFRREWLEEASLQTVEASQIGATKQQALYRKRDLFVFDEENLTVYRERAWMYRDLPLQDGHRERANADDAFELLRSEAEKRMADIQTRNEAVLNLLSRLRFLNITPQDIAAVWNDAVAESLFGETSLQALVASESDLLAKTLERKLFEQREQFPSLERDLRETAPSHFTAPTGNRFRIHYPENQSPYTEVRLQELFGTSKHPMIGKGDRETPLTFHLLGPNYRPVQVTSDLPGFWKGSYFEVRKELRARYPKHSWPENPLEAPAVAKGRRY
jgi:ATP-dependent helicase HrpB